jgi:hypothetical protein
MKKFLLNLLFSTVFLIFAAILLDFVISSGLKKYERGHFIILNQLMSSDSINADIVISGTSRSAYACSPRILDSALNIKSFNLSTVGQKYSIMNLRENIYAKHNKPPKLLVEDVDCSTMNLNVTGFGRDQYYPYILDKSLRYILKQIYTEAELKLPLFRYRGDYKMVFYALLEFFHIKHTKYENYNGFVLHANRGEWDTNKFNEIIASNKAIYEAPDTAAFALMKATFQQHISRGTKILMIYSPLHSKMKDYLPQNDSIVAMYRSLVDNKNIFFIDYTNNPYNSDTTCFINVNHVNTKGTAIFSKQLARDIDSLGLLK